MWLPDCRRKTNPARTALNYLYVLKETTRHNLFHGDPHMGNVLIGVHPRGVEGLDGMKLCDYGTSLYLGKRQAWERHCRVVDEVFRCLLAKFATFNSALKLFRPMDSPADFDRIIISYSGVLRFLTTEIVARLNKGQKIPDTVLYARYLST